MRRSDSFNFVDLFAGIGGFHAALSAMGGSCLLASEIDSDASRIYEKNWGIEPKGDIRRFSNSSRVLLPPRKEKISVLTAGFPCQPFSKSGKQNGMNEERGTLFDHIMHLVEKRLPSLVLLENVRNLSGPRHKHEFEYIIKRLRRAGYLVSSSPSVFSPHRIKPEYGGRPQIRERLFIAATFAPRLSKSEPHPLVLPTEVSVKSDFVWDVREYLDASGGDHPELALTRDELKWLETWEKFQKIIRKGSREKLPGFPLWSDEWVKLSNTSKTTRLRGVPDWKRTFLENNWTFYETHKAVIDRWRRGTSLEEFPVSRRKLEWQAQDAESVWDCAVHFRPSGIRVKKLTYLPALVAMNQTSVICPIRRKLTPREAARLQGLPDSFDFLDQPHSKTYQQLGNGVNVGVVWQVMRSVVQRDRLILESLDPGLVDAVSSSPRSPDECL